MTVELIEISSRGTKTQRWRYWSRDVAMARVTALFVQYPMADAEERSTPYGPAVTLTVDHGIVD